MPFTQNRNIKELVFTNKRVLDLLSEIRDFFKKDVVLENAIEKYLEDLNIVYDNETMNYIASVYIIKNGEEE